MVLGNEGPVIAQGLGLYKSIDLASDDVPVISPAQRLLKEHEGGKSYRLVLYSHVVERPLLALGCYKSLPVNRGRDVLLAWAV